MILLCRLSEGMAHRLLLRSLWRVSHLGHLLAQHCQVPSHLRARRNERNEEASLTYGCSIISTFLTNKISILGIFMTEPFNGCRSFPIQLLMRIDCFVIQMTTSDYHQMLESYGGLRPANQNVSSSASRLIVHR